MKFLADLGVSMTTVRVLREHGHAIVIVEDTRYRLRRLPIEGK